MYSFGKKPCNKPCVNESVIDLQLQIQQSLQNGVHAHSELLSSSLRARAQAHIKALLRVTASRDTSMR